MAIVAILQPVYLPWLGYFEQMALSDRFIFMDDVKYTPRDWRNRNRVKSQSGAIWLTFPIKRKNFGAEIREIEVNYEHRWVSKHLRTLSHAYAKAPYRDWVLERIVPVLESRPKFLVDLDCALIEAICTLFEITTPTSLSSEVPRTEISHGYGEMDRLRRRNERVLEICRFFDADLLYNGASSADYMDRELFRKAGVEVVFQDYRHPIYRQLHGDYSSHLSAIDLLMNVGPEAKRVLRSSPLPPALRRRVESR